MAAIDDLMRVVDEVISASAQLSTAHRNGESWEQQTDDRKHYAARWCALRDMLQNLLNDRTELEYEATMLMTAMTDVLHHFTKTPSTLADSEVRGMGHAANARMRAKLQEMVGRVEAPNDRNNRPASAGPVD
jgi:hypothetical protein